MPDNVAPPLTYEQLYTRLTEVERESTASSEAVTTQYTHVMAMERRVTELAARMEYSIQMFRNLQTIIGRLQAEDIDRKRDWWKFLDLLSKQEPEVMEAVKEAAALQLAAKSAWKPDDGLAARPGATDEV